MPGMWGGTESRRDEGMRRHLFTLLSVLSLVLCVGTCVLWVRSYYPPSFHVRPQDGRLFLVFTDWSDERYSDLKRINLPPHSGTLDFDHLRQFNFPGGEFHAFVIPIYFPFVVSLLLPLVYAARSMRRHKGSSRNRCIRCGYDLRATPERCPECGAVPEAAGVKA